MRLQQKNCLIFVAQFKFKKFSNESSLSLRLEEFDFEIILKRCGILLCIISVNHCPEKI